VNEGTQIGREPAVGDEDRLRRREQIMTAAKNVFVRNGFHGTTIAEVVKEASLPFDAVYQHFDSKDALFRALIAAEGYALRTYVAVALAKSGTQFGFAEAPFRASLRATFEFFDANPATAKLLFRDAYARDSRFDKQLGGIYERFIDDIESLIVAAQDRGDVVAAPPRLVAYMLTALIGHMAYRRLTTDDGVSAAEAADLVVALVIKGLRPSES
jgi:AcrR family transcriptional regulator